MSLHPLGSEGVIRLPNDTDSELAALAVILSNDPEHLRGVARIGLTAECFYDQANRTIYEAVLTLAEHGEPFDAAAVRTQLKATQKATKRTDAALIALSGELAATTTLHAERVVKAARDRRMLSALRDAAARVEAGGSFDPSSLAFDTAGPGIGFVPADLLSDEDAPEPVFLGAYFPYLPQAARVWAIGPAEAAKSMWAAWVAASLTREGYRVVYLSQENPWHEDKRRWRRLRADLSNLTMFHATEGLDLSQPEWRTALRAACDGADLVVLDTLTAVWGGDENSNADAAAFDREVLYPIVKGGCTTLTIHHTGHAGAFGEGKGRGRGASSFEQKADAVLIFDPENEPGAFRITHKKNRFGGYKAPVSHFRVVDLEDGGLSIATEHRTLAGYSEADADVAVNLIRSAGEVGGKKALHKALTWDGGLSHQRAWAAIARLDAEEPRRVIHRREVRDTPGGPQAVEVYTLSEPTLGDGN